MFLGLLVAASAGAAVVYKWTDADGVVHYSDQAVPGAEKIVTSSGAANGIGGSTHSASAQPADKPGAAKRLAYSEFSIESPAKEEVFFGDDVVPVRLHLEPELQPKQEVVWYLNGAPQRDVGPTTVSFALPAMQRGTYVLSATVTDTITGDSQSTETVTFYVRQPSDLAPLNPQRKK